MCTVCGAQICYMKPRHAPMEVDTVTMQWAAPHIQRIAMDILGQPQLFKHAST